MEVRKLIGWNIRRLRVARGLTIEDLADLGGLTPNYLGELERGQVNVGAMALDRLARGLKVSLGELVEEPAPGSVPPKPLRAGRRPSKAKQRRL
jgi:transcriptional regulator with XRE-family HTH domain